MHSELLAQRLGLAHQTRTERSPAPHLCLLHRDVHVPVQARQDACNAVNTSAQPRPALTGPGKAPPHSKVDERSSQLAASTAAGASPSRFAAQETDNDPEIRVQVSYDARSLGGWHVALCGRMVVGVVFVCLERGGGIPR